MALLGAHLFGWMGGLAVARALGRGITEKNRR